MIDNTKYRNRITKIILSQIKPDYTEEDLNKAKVEWWTNIRKSGGGSLTSIGKEAFESAEVEYWDLTVNIGYVITSKPRVNIDRALKCPYFIYVKQSGAKMEAYIRIYGDSKTVVIVQLHGGIKNYIDSLNKKTKPQ